jgi:hypothetical protein
MTMELVTCLGSNSPYFMVFLLILFVWDLIDLYVRRSGDKYSRCLSEIQGFDFGESCICS